MVISETHKFIFVAVPKTGSSSMEKVLAPYQSSLTEQFNRHATCLKLQRELPQEIWASKKPSAGLQGIWTSKSRGIVNEYFREDFEFFDYRMLLK